MYVGILPSIYGGWLYLVFGLTQHAGLAEDVLDHRLNSRTVYMNPVLRFLYWNMNYHVEHHMFPMVPYHALPKLHEEMKPYTPTPYRGLFDAYREIIPALLKQVKDPTYHVVRKLPEGARPLGDGTGLGAAAQGNPSPPEPRRLRLEGARPAHQGGGDAAPPSPSERGRMR